MKRHRSRAWKSCPCTTARQDVRSSPLSAGKYQEICAKVTGCNTYLRLPKASFEAGWCRRHWAATRKTRQLLISKALKSFWHVIEPPCAMPVVAAPRKLLHNESSSGYVYSVSSLLTPKRLLCGPYSPFWSLCSAHMNWQEPLGYSCSGVIANALAIATKSLLKYLSNVWAYQVVLVLYRCGTGTSLLCFRHSIYTQSCTYTNI